MAIDTNILPDYDAWSKDDWINFHRILKSKFGRENANKVWSQFFNNKPIGWTRDHVYTADPEFKKYFGSQGITFDASFYSQLDRIGGFLSSIPAGIKTTAIIVGVVGGTSLLFFIGLGIYTSYKTTKALSKTAGNALKDPDLLAKAAKFLI